MPESKYVDHFEGFLAAQRLYPSMYIDNKNSEEYNKFHQLLKAGTPFQTELILSFASIFGELFKSFKAGLISSAQLNEILMKICKLGHAAHELNKEELVKIQQEFTNSPLILDSNVLSTIKKTAIIVMGLLLGLSIGLIVVAATIMALTGDTVEPALILTIIPGVTAIGSRLPRYPLHGAAGGLVLSLLVTAAIEIGIFGSDLPLPVLIASFVLSAILGTYATHSYFKKRNETVPLKHMENINQESEKLAKNLNTFFSSQKLEIRMKDNFAISHNPSHAKPLK